MKAKFLPTTLNGKFGHVVEECGEVQAAIGKIIRFGINNSHPETKETNRAMLVRELRDLKFAINRLEKVI